MSIVSLVLVLFAATAGMRVVADRSNIPLPTLLVLGGLCVALIPGLPRLSLDPETVFLIFIPPLLFWASLTTSLRDLRRNIRGITLLAVFLILVTMVVVACVAHKMLPALSWAMCFVLGAIVSPPDAIAVSASTRRLRLPRDMLAILDGESLMNDATCLVAYQVALVAAVTGTFSLVQAGTDLVLTSVGGVVIGLMAGWSVRWVRTHIKRSSVVDNTISLLSPFLAFIPATYLRCSGVLAVVAMGLYLGRDRPALIAAETRLQATAMWEILTFLLEGLIFIFIGLQLPVVIASIEASQIAKLIEASLAIAGAMMFTRLLWVFPGAYLPRWIDARLQRPTHFPPWRQVLFVGWAGIRGGDSLVIALAIPYVNSFGAPLLGREAAIFITFVVILITLVGQGLTLAPLIKILGIVGGDEDKIEERNARHTSVQAAAEAIAHLSKGAESAMAIAADFDRGTDSAADDRKQEFRRAEVLKLRIAMIAARRMAVLEMRNRDEIGDSVMRKLQNEFDHEEILLRHRYGEESSI
jgi:CPA1 family monovalent cation:H+ antiporter